MLNRTVERNERIRELAERPLLLTLIAQLQTEGGGTLPEKREELYDKAVEMLLTKWETMKVRVREDGTKEIEPSLAEWLNAGRDDIRKQLNRLAFEAHRDQPQLTGTADIRQETLIAALLNASARRDDVNVGLLEKYLRDRAGILAAHGVGMYQFPHRSFQEYLAACHLTDDEFPGQAGRAGARRPEPLARGGAAGRRQGRARAPPSRLGPGRDPVPSTARRTARRRPPITGARCSRGTCWWSVPISPRSRPRERPSLPGAGLATRDPAPRELPATERALAGAPWPRWAIPGPR